MTVFALLLLPLVGAALLVALRGRPAALGPVAVLVLVTTLFVAASAAVLEPTATWRWSRLIELSLSVDGFSRVMVVLVPLIAIPVVAYASATERQGRVRLLALLLTFVAAMLLLVTAADFVTLLIGWELVGFVSWALIGHAWRDPASPGAAAEAFVTTRLGDVGLYLATGLALAAAGSFRLSEVGSIGRPALDLIAGGVLVAAVAKSAQLPFAPWLFAAMAGPTPVSALLHSATLVAAGAYLLIRLAPAFEPIGWFGPAVAGVGLATALAGGLVATLQTHAKRALAASTSAQYGLMFVAVGLGSTAAAGAHLVAHAGFKSLLFLATGIAIHTARSSRLDELGVGRRLPRVALLSAVAALALAAVPPLGGAWTKEQIVAAALHASPWVGAGVLAAGFLSALYAARYQLLVFGATGGGARDSAAPSEPSARSTELVALSALAVLSLALGALWLPRAGSLVEAAVGGQLAASAAWEPIVALAAVVAAFGLAWWLLQRRRLVSLGLPLHLRGGAEAWLGLQWTTRAAVSDPVVSLSHRLARFDDRVIDAGVRAVAWLAGAVSRLFSNRGEWTFDGAVRAVAAATLWSATASRVADDRGVDAAVEGGARGIALAGRTSPRLQTGQAHHYYVIVAVGLAGMLVLLALVR